MFKRVQLVFLETSKANKMAALWLAKWPISSCPKDIQILGRGAKLITQVKYVVMGDYGLKLIIML